MNLFLSVLASGLVLLGIWLFGFVGVVSSSKGEQQILAVQDEVQTVTPTPQLLHLAWRSKFLSNSVAF